jgi:hypothetical protein
MWSCEYLLCRNWRGIKSEWLAEMVPVGVKKIVRENFKIATVSSQGGDFAPIPVYKVAIKKIKYMPRPPDHSQKIFLDRDK